MIMVMIVSRARAAGLGIVGGQHGSHAQHTLHLAHGLFALAAKRLHFGPKLRRDLNTEANMAFAQHQALNKAR